MPARSTRIRTTSAPCASPRSLRQTALVQVEPDYLENVYVPVPTSQDGAILEQLGDDAKHPLRDGQQVEQGQILAIFRSLEVEKKLAEAQGHHPDIYLAWGKVRLTIWTHKIDGLTESDFIFAAKADKVL